MTTVILVIHVMLAIALVAVVLLQRSEGGALGIGGGGGMGGLMTGRATANLLSRTTAVLAALFMLTSLTLAYMSKGPSEPKSILEQPPGQTMPALPAAPAPTPPAPGEAPQAPAEPEVPLAQ